MVRLHAVALGRNSALTVAKPTLLIVCTALAAGCATTPRTPGDSEPELSERRLIYLETNEFRWVDAPERQRLACANGTVVLCTTGLSRLSLANCGCLAVD
jgi:hypothetical protein